MRSFLIALFLLLASSTGCLAAPADDPVSVFEYVWEDFDRNYGNFAVRDIDWDAAYETWRPQVSETSTDDELFAALTGMLATLDDGHTRLVAPGRETFWSNSVYRDRTMLGTFDDEVVRTYLSDPDTGDWDWYLRGTLAPGVAYLWLPGIDDNTHVIDDIVDENPTSLIIDMRHSHGGAFTFGMHGLGRLLEEDVLGFRSRTRNGPGREDFDEWFDWVYPARGPYWGGEIYLLMDAETISASERLALVLKELPNVTTIGVTSNGALATSVAHEAPNGWQYQLSVQEVQAADGTVHEGVGIPVDIEMLNDPADVAAGRDRVLEYTLELAQSAP